MAKTLIVDKDHILGQMVCCQPNRLAHEMICAHPLAQRIEAAVSKPAFDLAGMDAHLSDGSKIFTANITWRS